MLQDAKLTKPQGVGTIEDLGAALAELRAELAEVSESVAHSAERRGRRMINTVSEEVGGTMHRMERKGAQARVDLEQSIALHPMLALGIAAAAGLLVGALSRR